MFQRGLTPPDPFGERDILESARTQDSMSLRTLASLGRVLVVLLPPMSRARAWLSAVREARPALEADGLRLVLVHPEAEDEAREALGRFDLQYLARIADPEHDLYRFFELGETRPWVGPARPRPGLVWLEGGDVVGVERAQRERKAPVGLIGPNRGAAPPP